MLLAYLPVDIPKFIRVISEEAMLSQCTKRDSTFLKGLVIVPESSGTSHIRHPTVNGEALTRSNKDGMVFNERLDRLLNSLL